MTGVAVIISVLVLMSVLVYRHQCLLRDRARIMRDAMRHRDFSFRLPTKGLLFGERALQEALNQMGHDIEKLEAHNEVESWQRLTRVLTHEIMNVMAPIQSISQAYLSDPDIKDSPYKEGLQAILDSSSGLTVFVSNYRKMTQLQAPVMRDIDFAAFSRSIASLYPELKWEIDGPADMTLRADEDLFRQVFINIVKNAKEADARKIGIRYSESRISISNDGHVIPDDVAREIFIPFFTTKPEGSGIGLSMSRQVLMGQGYLLRLAEHSEKNYNVTFILEW
ncbi:MAG: HAMP domain-containing histidine kinase [Muribaculaceae bacterium]|nr:HAMP domain-containing histidine kinase [Muribaculaceae bacterium]MDE6855643.1 HAMP domain-containing histidine kinase [Muribaculaceae bacterium]